MKLLIFFVSAPLFANVFCAKYSSHESRRTLVHQGWVKRQVRSLLSERVSPRYFVEHELVSPERLTEICHPHRDVVARELAARRVEIPPSDSEVEGRDEVFTLIENGPPENRIDLVFMGDGYLESEKGKFLADMKRLTAELFEGKTFSSYLPIFNVYAVFRASGESGIGKNDTPKNTAYRLYRLGNTLRAIYVGNAGAAHDSCSKAPGCDYPILIANDRYYGGLGGEFSVSTSSPTSGMVVLRHELGHSVGDIGEEYDGGGYFGANHASSLSTLGWKHWATGPIQAEPSTSREISWPWVNLSSGPFLATFISDGLWQVVNIQISVSGAQTNRDFLLSMDGKALPFQSPGHEDRDFHSFTLVGFSAGQHELRFEEGIHDGDNWVSSISVHEFKEGYHFDPNYIGAYPLFTGTRVPGYRPTHDTCLMRNMKSDRFCPVCQENNWIKFFRSIKMIDSITVTPSGQRAIVRVDTQKLGQFSKGNGKVKFRWFKGGVEEVSLQGLSQVTIFDLNARWEVEASYETPEVRKDPAGVLKSRQIIVF